MEEAIKEQVSEISNWNKYRKVTKILKNIIKCYIICTCHQILLALTHKEEMGHLAVMGEIRKTFKMKKSGCSGMKAKFGGLKLTPYTYNVSD
jgi:hypothetical protein